MDLYVAFDDEKWPGLGPGLIGSRPQHPVMGDWRNMILAYYGYRKDVYGAQDLLPMPTFREDIIVTSGPRSLTFAIWVNLNKWGYNDAIFKNSMVPTSNSGSSEIGKETLKIGGKEQEFERFGHFSYERDAGFRTKSGQWYAPKDLTW